MLHQRIFFAKKKNLNFSFSLSRYGWLTEYDGDGYSVDFSYNGEVSRQIVQQLEVFLRVFQKENGVHFF